jgi:hypothetical protein
MRQPLLPSAEYSRLLMTASPRCGTRIIGSSGRSKAMIADTGVHTQFGGYRADNYCHSLLSVINT